MQSVLIEDSEWRDDFGKKLFNLQQSGQFCDVIIKTVEDARLLVHSCVLAAASPLLKGVIESALSDATLGTIMLSSDIDVNTWTHMLEFMYTGCATVPDDLVASLQSGATILKVDTLVNRCNEILQTLTKIEEEAVPVEATDIYSAIAQIKEDTEPIIEDHDGIVTVIQGDMQVEGTIVTQQDLPEGTIVTQQGLPEGTIITQQGLPEGTIVTQADIDETPADLEQAQADFDEAHADLDDEQDGLDEATDNDMNETQEGIDATQVAITEEQGIEGQEAIAAVQDEMDTQDYIDDVHDIQSAPVEVIAAVNVEEVVAFQHDEESYAMVTEIATSFQETSENTKPHSIPDSFADDTSDIQFEFHGYTKSGRKTFKCLSCDKVVRERAEHKVAHTQMKRFMCDVEGCQKVYKRKQGLRLHQQTHTSDITSILHECDKCGKSYKTPHLLYKHKTVSCNNDRLYTCSICHKKLKTSRQLKYHEATHSSDKPIECNLCGKALPSDEHFKVHLSMHDNTNVKCHCGKSFTTYTACKSHQEKDHKATVLQGQTVNPESPTNQQRTISLPGDAKHECHVCKVKFKKKFQFNLHMAKHLAPYIPCPECGKKFKTKQHLKSHLLSHEKPFKCDYCDIKFAHASYLKKHKSTCGQQPEKDLNLLFKCQHCFQVFQSSKSVRLHAEKSHPDIKCVGVTSLSGDMGEGEWHVKPMDIKMVVPNAFFNCEICNAVFRLESSLIKHEIDKHFNQRKNCSVCNVTFVTSRTLRKHEYESHGLGSLCTCDLCARDFYTQCDLDSHQKVVHDTSSKTTKHMQNDKIEEQRFTCKTLGDTSSKEYLDLAVQQQSFTCIACCKSFPSAEILFHHEKTHAVWEFECKMCSKTFAILKTLKKHISRCSNIETTCVYCSEIFDQKKDLAAHLLLHTVDKVVYKCSICFEVFIGMIELKKHSSSNHHKMK